MSSNDTYNSAFVRYSNNGKLLCFFGALHSHDDQHPQFDLLKRLWDFFSAHVSGDTVLLIEADRNAEEKFKGIQNFEEGIRQYGEPGGAYFLARQMETEVIFPEPKYEDQIRALGEIFGKEDIAYAFIVQRAQAYFQAKRALSFRQTFEKNYLAPVAKLSSVFGFTPTMDWFEKKHKELFGDRPFDDEVFIRSVSDPRRTDTPINKIVAKRTAIRNEALLQMIKENLEAGKSIFIVYGRGHLDTLQNELARL